MKQKHKLQYSLFRSKVNRLIMAMKVQNCASYQPRLTVHLFEKSSQYCFFLLSTEQTNVLIFLRVMWEMRPKSCFGFRRLLHLIYLISTKLRMLQLNPLLILHKTTHYLQIYIYVTVFDKFRFSQKIRKTTKTHIQQFPSMCNSNIPGFHSVPYKNLFIVYKYF